MASHAATCTLSGSNTTLTCTGGPAASITVSSSGVFPASPYPSAITVSGITGSVTAVQVILNGVAANGTTGSTLEGAGILLAAGTSGHYLEILHSVGNGGDESATLSSDTINLADSNSSLAPNNTTGFFCGNGVTCTVSATTFNWKPSSYPDFALAGGSGEYPSPAPPAGAHAQLASSPATVASATFASVFTGDSPNQTWNLYMENDDSSGNAVSFTSWTLVLTLSVSSTSTTTSLSSSVNSSFTSSPNNTTTFTATVTGGTGPTGTVTFTDASSGNVNLTCAEGTQPRTLNGSGQATCTSSFTTEGIHTIEATYNPSGAFLTSNSTVNQFVKNHSTIVSGAYCNTGSISVPGVSNTSPYPSVVNVGTDTTALANSLSTLSVTLKNLSTTAVGGLSATDMLVVAPDNTHALDFLAFAGGGFSIPTAINLTLEDSSSNGQVPFNFSSSPSGNVNYQPTYYDNSFTITAPPLPAPQPPATYALSLPGGGASAKSFTTEFNGLNGNGDWKLFLFDSNNLAVTVAGGWCLNFTQSTGTLTATTVNGTPNRATTGVTVTITATVLSGGSPVTSGTVTFTDDGVSVAGGPTSPVTVDVNGHASFTTSSLSEGDHTILATYNGNATYSLSLGSYVQRVDDATAGPTISVDTFTYCNTGAITLPGLTNADDIGQASPNPSNIFVTALPGTISAVQVDLKSLHMQGTDDDTGALLVGPTAIAADSLDFFSNTGTGAGTITGNFSFLDNTASLVPSGSEPAAGSYKPTSFGTAPTYFSSTSPFYTLPAGPYPRAATAGTSTLNGVFNGGSGNGTWSLYFDQNTHAPSNGATNGWCLDLTVTPPVLTITKGHTGPGTGNAFIAGQTGTYTINVGNNGPGSTGGQTVTVTDNLPSGLTQSSVSGTGWNCSSSTSTAVSCTSTTAISPSGSFPAISVTVTPALTSGASASNTASVAGAGMTGATSTADVATIIHAPVLSLGIVDNGSPAGSFKQGSTGDTATVTLTNASAASGAGPTSSTVVVTFTLSSASAIVPQSITPPGSGWTCETPSASFTCSSTGSPALAAGGSAQFTLNFNVSATATSPQSIAASVSGGGGNAPSGTDTLTIIPAPVLSVSKSHTGTFTQGGTAVWNIQVTNNSSTAGSATTGTTTVSDTLPAGYTLASFSGSGWSCSGTTIVSCMSTNTVAGAGGTFPVLGLTVNVPGASPVSVSNTAITFGGGDPVHVALGSAATSNTDTVTVVQTPASMTANAGTTPQTATVSMAFAIALAVTVKDAGSNPVSGVSVVFTAPSTGASGTFGNGMNTITMTTNASGVASAPFTANSTAGGPYTVTAAATGLTTLNFSLTNSAGTSPSGPSVVSFSVLFGSEKFNVIGTARNRLPWQVTGIQVLFSEVIDSANVNSLSGVTTTGFSGLGTNTLTWTISPISLGNFATTLAGSGPNAIEDAGSVGLSAGAGFAQNFRVLWGDFNDDGIVNSQDQVLVNAARSTSYNILADLNGDGVVNTSDVLVARSQVGNSNP